MLKDILNNVYIIYLNNILIFFKSEEVYKEYIRIVLDCLTAAKLYTKLSKCKFYVTKVEFLSFLIFINRVSIDLSYITTICD